MNHPAALDAQALTRRFKPRKNYKAPRLENAEYSEADTQVVVLCGMSTLLSPQEIPSLSNTLNGQVPCEGYFIVVDVENPQIPLLEKGFIFLPDRRQYSQKKTALENLNFRIRAVHGIDPEQRGLQVSLRSRLLQTEGSAAEEHFVVTSDLSFFVKKVLEPVLDTVHRFKSEVGSTCIFLTVNDSTELDNVKMGLKWLYAQQTQVKPFRCATFRINDLFPGVTDYVGHEHHDESERARGICNRCVMHPVTTLSRQYGKPHFCSKLFARRLWWAICDLEVASRDMDAVLDKATPSGPGDAVPGAGTPNLAEQVSARVAQLELPFFMDPFFMQLKTTQELFAALRDRKILDLDIGVQKDAVREGRCNEDDDDEDYPGADGEEDRAEPDEEIIAAEPGQGDDDDYVPRDE